LFAKKLLLVVLIFCNGYCYASTIKITADYKHYDKYRNVLIAKGNVIVESPDFRVRSPYVIWYIKDEKIMAMDKFEFEKEGYRISGNSLEYHYEKGTGNAETVRVNFGNTFLGARDMALSKDKFEMYDAYFTGCDAPSSHYHIAARQLSLYPNTGLIVAYYATCFVWIAPILPLPTFIYYAPVPKSKFINKGFMMNDKTRAEGTEEEIKTTQPVPEIGNNPVDGTFIRQGLNWYFGPKRYMKLLLSYMGTNHFGIGISANYILSDRDEGEIRMGDNEGEKFFWGITHYFSFGPKLVSSTDEEQQVYDFYRPGGKYSYELEAKYSVRERINLDQNDGPFSRVSFTPKITLRSNRKPIPYLGEHFTYFAEASYANVSEEVSQFETSSPEAYTQSSPRRNYFADVTYDGKLGMIGDLKAVIDLSLSDYGKLGSWDTSRQQLYLQQHFFDRLTLEYGHIHYIMQRGFSPYVFEGYYYSPYDQFVGGMGIKAWYSTFKFTTSYNLPSWDLYNVKYEWLFGMHCYNLVFAYNLRNSGDVFRSEFNFSIELVPSRW
jgi:hypothetical protein